MAAHYLESFEQDLLFNVFSWGVVCPCIFSLRIAPVKCPLIFLDLNKAAWQIWTVI